MPGLAPEISNAAINGSRHVNQSISQSPCFKVALYSFEYQLAATNYRIRKARIHTAAHFLERHEGGRFCGTLNENLSKRTNLIPRRTQKT